MHILHVTIYHNFCFTISLIRTNNFLQKIRVVLTLNNYVKQTVQKVIQPLMLQNECKNFQLNTTNREFEKHWPEPDKEEWQELTKYKVEESQKGRLSMCMPD